jgi:hypothetical protein
MMVMGGLSSEARRTWPFELFTNQPWHDDAHSSLFVPLVGLALIIDTKDPDASPDIPYPMQVIIIVNCAASLTVQLVKFKLRLIWRGEKVVISRLLAEQRSKSASESSLSGGIPTSSISKVSDSRLDEPH